MTRPAPCTSRGRGREATGSAAVRADQRRDGQGPRTRGVRGDRSGSGDQEHTHLPVEGSAASTTNCLVRWLSCRGGFGLLINVFDVTDDGVDLVEIALVGAASDGVGCTPFSFSAFVAPRLEWLPRPSVVPERKGRPSPRYWHCDPIIKRLEKEPPPAMVRAMHKAAGAHN